MDDTVTLVRLLLWGGLRREEALAFDCNSVDDSQIFVGGAAVWSRKRKEWVIEKPKNGRGRRVLLPPVTLRRIHELAAVRGTGALWQAAKGHGRLKAEPVHGLGYLMHEVPRLRWYALRDAAGVGRDGRRTDASMRGGMQVKDLRAAHASLLAAIGASPPEAQQQLGHALGTLTTMRHYSRVLEVRELQEVGSRPGMSGMLDRLEAAEEVVDSGR